MKKLVALLMALCLLVSTALAAPGSDMPTNLSEIDLPEIPAIPEFSIKTNGDAYEVTVEGVDGSNATYSALEVIGTWEYNWCRLELTWDDSRKCFVSNGTMSDIAFANASIEVHWKAGEGLNLGVKASQADRELQAASVTTRGDQYYCEYEWSFENNMFEYSVYDATKWVYLYKVTYSLQNGRPLFYTIYPEEELEISYNRFGVITEAEFYKTGSYYSWDAEQQCWLQNGQPAETTLPAATLENYPAPYAEEYAPKLPPATLAECDPNAGTMEVRSNGITLYDDTLVTGVYDPAGNLLGYSYSSIDGRKFVQYDVNGVLVYASIECADGYYGYNDGSWDSPLPEGVNLDDVGPLKAE